MIDDQCSSHVLKKARAYAQARAKFELDDLAEHIGGTRVDALCALLMASGPSGLVYEIGEGNNPTIRVVGLN